MTKLHTLTVPDMLWINLRVTGSPQDYNFATLEEGTFYQYKTGQNSDLSGQSARFLTGFTKLEPFATGNTSTAFVGFVTFLSLNGKDLNLDDQGAKGWLKELITNPKTASEMVSQAITESHHHATDSRNIIDSIFERYPETIASLSNA